MRAIAFVLLTAVVVVSLGTDASEDEPPSPPSAPRWRHVMFSSPSPRLGSISLVQLRYWANLGNAVLLAASAPLQWRAAGVTTLLAARSLLLSGWLSACGLLLMLREVNLPPMRRWMRRHVRFATSSRGRTAIHLFAATLAITSGGGVGVVVGVTTLSNAAFGRYVRRTLRSAKVQREFYASPPLVGGPVNSASSANDQEPVMLDGVEATQMDGEVSAHNSGAPGKRAAEVSTDAQLLVSRQRPSASGQQKHNHRDNHETETLHLDAQRRVLQFEQV